MSGSAAVFNTREAHGVVEQPTILAEGTRRKQQAQQQRQLLSCTKCRERKVKCDRTKPCSACCARGAPKECRFIAEGGDYTPIQQSYELRKLRAENLRLKERLRAGKISIEDDDSDPNSPDSQLGERTASSSQRKRAARQKRFQGPEWSDSIYFGSPGLANVITDFASINLTPMSTQSLAHLMPRGADMYASRTPPPHPFATLFKATPEDCIPQLLSCLPATEELFDYLDSFQRRAHICSFPHIPIEITKSEVERFLSDAKRNAQMCPDMLALLFTALALGSQHSVWDKCGGQWEAEAMDEERQKGNVYIAAAMQALRMASFMHKPTLLGIQALIMIGPYLTNSGRFLDAWTLFGTTIRMAQSIGLHRHPKYLDPAPPTQRECSIRQTLWWWMLHMDQEYSMTLGRPLGISGIGDCPPPQELTTDQRMLRFGEFVNHFTLLARQILSSDRLTNTKIDEFTDQLKGLLDTMPEMLQFEESWLSKDKEIPEWPLGAMAAGNDHTYPATHLRWILTVTVFYCKTHNYLILLNRQRMDKHAQSLATPSTKTPPASWQSANQAGSSQPSPTPKTTLRGRSQVLSSSDDLLTAFLFFYYRVPAALICWTMGQQAFNSCMILLLDAMETGDLSRMRKVEAAFAVFQELEKKRVHKLASLAVERISWGINKLRLQGLGGVNGRWDATAAGRDQRQTDCDLQVSVGSEALQDRDIMHDTVMGNTGMLLLEDPGLQSFVPEAFAPLTWVVAGCASGDAGPTQLKQEERKSDVSAENIRLEDAKPSRMSEAACDPHTARSSEGLQGVHGSTQGSAPMRYATFSTASSQERNQPQGLTSPTSQTHAVHMNQNPHHSVQGTDTSSAPPSRHHSYPSLHQEVPTPLVPHPPYSNARRHHQPTRTSAPTYPPMIPGQNSSQPPFRTPPEMIVSMQTPTAHTGNPNVHPSWAARSAAPLSNVSEPAVTHTHVSCPEQAIPAPSYQTSQNAAMPAFQYTFPFHISTGSANNSALAVAECGTEALEIEGWKRWVGNSA